MVSEIHIQIHKFSFSIKIVSLDFMFPLKESETKCYSDLPSPVVRPDSWRRCRYETPARHTDNQCVSTMSLLRVIWSHCGRIHLPFQDTYDNLKEVIH